MPPPLSVKSVRPAAIVIGLSISLVRCQNIVLSSTLDTDEAAEGASSGGHTSSTPTTTGEPPPGTTGDPSTDSCVPESHSACFAGDLYWFDSCDTPGALLEDCPGECVDGACAPVCSTKYVLTTFKCPAYSMSDGSGPGGGESMIVCANTDEDTGHLQVIARRRPGDPQPTFDERPYQVRVSQLNDGDCGPDTHYFDPSDNAPVGVGTNELAFNFASIWLPDQTQKAYCVTASVQPGEDMYDARAPGMASWWFSDKIVLNRTEVCE